MQTEQSCASVVSMWSITDLNSKIAANLREHELFLVEDHAHSGLDAMREIDLHPIAIKGLADPGFTVLRESCLPSTKRELPGKNARERVDFVLLPDQKKSLFDPVDAHKELRGASGTLFESFASLAEPKQEECDPRDAMWIEMKCVPQIRYVDGVPTPNSKYELEMINGPSEDVIKLASDPLICHGAVLVVVFNEHAQAGPHDLAMSVRTMIDRDLPVGLPEIEQFPIQDRAGNAWCTLGMIPVRM